ncbi:MAG: hypothetical protein IPM11_11300 [Micropruina sp.]|nr:hypothetical protein [Micropruina sp.]
MTRQRGADACHDPPPRWWTDAEVRAALGRRATLDAVDTTPQPDGTLWQAHYSVGRGGELIGSV